MGQKQTRSWELPSSSRKCLSAPGVWRRWCRNVDGPFPSFHLCICLLVVTGASEGIGRAYAFEVSRSASVQVSNILIMCPTSRSFSFIPCLIFYSTHPPRCSRLLQLAKRGVNVVIMSRTKEALDQVAREISKEHWFFFVFFFFYYFSCF